MRMPDHARMRRRPVAGPLLALVALVAASGSIGSSRPSAARRLDRSFSDAFVTRSGPRLYVAGRPFRFGGANIEWLGLVGYGPHDPNGPRRPSHYEIDDAMATARELGARVVRSQTMGDSVGCERCLEPSLGQFNTSAFEPIDYALVSARAHGIKIIPTIVGDDARRGGGGCVYLGWRGISVPDCSLINMAPFWSDQTVLADVEEHITALLDHVNVYTRVAYKNDPTILGWDLLNGGGSPAPWTRQIARYLRARDRHHLILSGGENAGLAGVDACVGFVYPHWSQPLRFVRRRIAACKAAGKPFIAYEYGWDRTNYPTHRALAAFLRTLARDREFAGDAFWALQSHADGHGWMPIPADTADPATARDGESGQWWALYYTGIDTMVNSAQDMAARAQLIRRHNYAMMGRRVPAHAIPPASTVTSVEYRTAEVTARVYWRGSAGAKNYAVQRAAAARGPWTTICRRCVTDADDGFADAGARASSWYRVIPYNLDGKPGHASSPVQASAG
jgi:mannan endo-1,4-beta-mannosidase